MVKHPSPTRSGAKAPDHIAGLGAAELRAGPAGFYGGADSAARTEDALDHSPDRVGRLHDIFKDLVDDVFLEDAEVAIAEEILLERLELEAALAGHVADGQNAEVGQTGLGADAGQLGIVNFDLVARELVLPGFDGGKFEVKTSLSVVVRVTGICRHIPIVRMVALRRKR